MHKSQLPTKLDKVSIPVVDPVKDALNKSTSLKEYEDYDKCKRAYDTNINWILGFIKIQPIPYQYEYYLDKSRKIDYSLP